MAATKKPRAARPESPARVAERQMHRDIKAVEEVLGWDMRGDEEEYRLMDEAGQAFARLKRTLQNLMLRERYG